MPAQQRVRANQQSKPAQRRTGQRHKQHCEQCPVLRPQAWRLVAELSPQDSELVA